MVEERSLQPEELSSFLEEWKRELSSQRNFEPSKKILQSSVYQPHYPEHQPHYYEDNSSSTVILGYKRETPLLDDDTGPPKKQYHQTIDDQLTDLTDSRKAIIGGSSLFVLPGGAICIQTSKNGERYNNIRGREGENSEDRTKRKEYESGSSLHNEEQLIDKLISDLVRYFYYQSIHLSVYPFIYFIYPFFYLFIHPSIHLFIYPFIHPSIFSFHLE